ncbi:MAG: hypothetical protein JJU05_08855 [Verrucomicrobia bacterium]|nr:hypothetical protein [Verrucomicrobiota bacterium]MCH8527001.1 hypothetical protein [Kiritimatiellia bacterium]
MKQLIHKIPVLTAFLLLLAPSARSELLAYEGFDYRPGTTRLHQAEGGPVGGRGWEGGWINFAQGNFVSARISASNPGNG